MTVEADLVIWPAGPDPVRVYRVAALRDQDGVGLRALLVAIDDETETEDAPASEIVGAP